MSSACVTIVAAAIMQDGKVYTGRRHYEIIEQIHIETGKKPVDGEQGFVTSEGVFVTREEAARIAFEAGQIRKRYSRLFSEDVIRFRIRDKVAHQPEKEKC